MVSTFQPSRRHALALAAFAALRQVRPEARLILVGDGALAPDLRRTTRDLGLDGAVIFAGYQRGADFVRWLQSFDLLWLLGLGNDFSARAAAQARACGVRVVGAREGALAQIADTLLADLTVDALVCASLEDTRRQHAWPTNREIAAEVIALYSSAYQRAPPK